MEQITPRHQTIIIHVIVAAILVWILPDSLLIPVIAYLTQESAYASWLIDTVKKRFTPPRERRHSVDLWVKNHYGTLKRIVRANSLERS